MHRRKFLAAAALGALVAGCTDIGNEDDAGKGSEGGDDDQAEREGEEEGDDTG